MSDTKTGDATPHQAGTSSAVGGWDAHALVDRLAIPAALLMGPAHTVMSASGSFRRMSVGGDPVGQPFYRAWPTGLNAKLLELLDRVFETGESGRMPGLPPLGDGGKPARETKRHAFVCESINDPDGTVRGVLFQVVESWESAPEEWAFLSEASEVLASSLDYDTTLSAVTRLAVAGIADWCAIDELLPGGEVRRIAVAHPDPEMVKLAHALSERYPPDPAAAHGVHQVLRTGEPELMPDIPDELLVQATRDEEHLRIVRALGLRSYICVPLIARGQTLGALTLIASEAGRRFGEADLLPARELARRAAIAIDNARLFRDSVEAQRVLEEQAIELEAQALELQQQACRLEDNQAELEAANVDLEMQATIAEQARWGAESARALLDAFIAAAPVAVGFVDRELRYRRVNVTLARIYGVEPDAMVGKSLREAIPGFASVVEPLYRQVLETGQAILNHETSAPRPTDPPTAGRYIVNYFPVRVREDEVIGVGVVAIDMTDLRRSQQRERVFSQVLEESRNEIYLFDAETLHFQQVNRGARENLGYSIDELRTMTPLDLKPDLAAEQFTALVAPLRTGGRELVQFETVHRRKDGSLYPVDVRLQLSTAGESPLFVALILDATERKRAEQALVAAREVAEQASLAKSQFLTVMSHELRTPLNAIVGYEDLLEAEVGGPINAVQREHLSRIKAGATQLLTLINQILSLARIESGREEVLVETVDLCILAEEAASLMEGLATQKGLVLESRCSEDPIEVETDAGKVRQILLNLVGNAVKFTERGTIVVSVAPARDSVGIRIQDTGPGIPPGLREEIFEPFMQADFSSTRNQGGTGLGLAVSRELARLLGGDVVVESTSEEGTIFTLTLPYRRAE